MPVISTTRGRVAVGVIALALATGACAAVTSSRSRPPRPVPSPPPIAAAPVVTDVTGLHLPIEAYMLTPTQSVESVWVDSVLISGCMQRLGFYYPAGARPAPNGTSVNAYTILFRRYGVTDAAGVRIWGYHVPRPTLNAPDQPDPKQAMSAAERRALVGTGSATPNEPGPPVPTGGCLAEPNRVLHNDDNAPQGPETGQSGLVATIKGDSFQDSMTDPRVTAVFARWSACMASHGYQIANPTQAARDLLSLNDPDPSAPEIAQAETDVACKTSTNLVGVWFTTEAAYQRIAIHQNIDRLDAIKARRDTEAVDIERWFRTHGG